MIFGLNLIREISFFSKKTATIIKGAIKPPKKVSNGYSLFYMEKYPEFKDKNMKITEISKELGKQWNNLSPELKSNFFVKAQNLKSSYMAQMESFKGSLTENEKIALKLLKMPNHMTRRKLDEKQKEFLKSFPETVATTPRGVFLSQRLKGVSSSEIKPSQGLSEAMKEWSNLSSKDQEIFAQQAQKNLKNYSEKITEFLKK